MFDKPTVFILVAGASCHYGYPTGEDLVGMIIEKTKCLTNCLKNEKRTFMKEALHNGKIHQCDIFKFFQEKFKDQSIDDILKHLNNFIDRLEQIDPPVIDHFLGWNEDLRDIGKLMIAWVILDCERVFNEKKGNINRQKIIDASPNTHERKTIDIWKFKDNWYRFVLYKILSNCKKSSDILENNVSFITFNYDVSLERSLHKGLKAIKFLKKQDNDIDSFLQDRFVHIYGKIREDSFTDFELIKGHTSSKEIKNYKNILDMAYKASKGINTIDPDDKSNDIPARDKARKLIKNAECVYILGYGFDESNNKRLDLYNLLSIGGIQKRYLSGEKNARKEVYFTNYGNKNSINKKASQVFFSNKKKFLKESIFDDSFGDPKREGYYEKSIKS